MPLSGMKIPFYAALAALSCGCAMPPNNPRNVSDALEWRTGQALAKQAVAPGKISIPPGINVDDGLSEDEAVSIALWNNAAFQEILADLGISRADLIQAGMLPNPTFSMLFPISTKPLELTVKYPFEVLWLRPRRVAAAKIDYERTAQRLVQSGLDLIRDTRVAYSDLGLANQRVKLSEASLKLSQEIARLAKTRLEAGEASELEVNAASVDALLGQEQLARSKHETTLARERLRNLLGMGLEEWPATIQDAQEPPFVGVDLSLVETNALQFRPDLRAAELNMEAAGKRIGLARAEVFTLAVSLNAKEVNQTLKAGPGLDFPIPVFNQNQGGVAQAKAAFAKAARQYITVRDRIIAEVRDAYTRWAQAEESRTQWSQRIVPPLLQAVDQAERAYAAGDVSYLLVLETRRKLEDARINEAAVAADLRRARAELERSAGGRLPETQKHANNNAN